MAATFATTNDARSRLHILDDGATLCGTDVTREANAETDAGKKVCFFCAAERTSRTQATPVVESPAETVTIRVAEVLVAYLGANVAGVAGAVEGAEVRRAGRGATYHLTLDRATAQAAHDHLVERLTHKRTGLGVQRWRAERAVRMIDTDLTA